MCMLQWKNNNTDFVMEEKTYLTLEKKTQWFSMEKNTITTLLLYAKKKQVLLWRKNNNNDFLW